MSLEERENSIRERGPIGETPVDPILDGNGYMKLTRTRKQMFAVSGKTVMNHLPLLRFTDEQKQNISLVGFYVEARLPGKGGDTGVCCPPDLTSFTELQNVDLKNLSPAVFLSRDDVQRFGVKGMWFNISDLPSGWEWDSLPVDSSLRITKSRGTTPGGKLKLDLSLAFVKLHNDACENEESCSTAALRRAIVRGKRKYPTMRKSISEEESSEEF
jgi:hypothetical protein